MHTQTLRPRLYALADQARRLTVSHRDPDRFHLDKDELVTEIVRLAEALNRDVEVYGVYRAALSKEPDNG